MHLLAMLFWPSCTNTVAVMFCLQCVQVCGQSHFKKWCQKSWSHGHLQTEIDITENYLLDITSWCCSTSSLDELFYFPDKLMASMRSSLQGAAEGALSCSAWLFVLACYQNTDLETIAEASTRAVQIAEDYMKAVADKVKSLMLRISEVN